MAVPWFPAKSSSVDGPELIPAQILDSVVELLASALELRDDETGQHARRVCDLGLALASVVAPELAADPQLRYGFLLHDIGKIGVPDRVLLKPNRFDLGEVRLVEQHTVLGAQLVKASPFLNGVAHDVIAFHHERWDGRGYPWGLAGEEIPLAARVFAVVDSFDALTNPRPHRDPVPLDDALTEIERHAGSQFDPAVVAKFLPLAPDLDRQTPRFSGLDLHDAA